MKVREMATSTSSKGMAVVARSGAFLTRVARAFSTSSSSSQQTPTAVASAIPENVTTRQVTIYTPARSASQQGMGNTIFAEGNSMWRIEFETESKWENPLMGWTSTADSLENVGRMTMAFDTKVSHDRGSTRNELALLERMRLTRT